MGSINGELSIANIHTNEQTYLHSLDNFVRRIKQIQDNLFIAMTQYSIYMIDLSD